MGNVSVRCGGTRRANLSRLESAFHDERVRSFFMDVDCLADCEAGPDRKSEIVARGGRGHRSDPAEQVRRGILPLRAPGRCADHPLATESHSSVVLDGSGTCLPDRAAEFPLAKELALSIRAADRKRSSRST